MKYVLRMCGLIAILLLSASFVDAQMVSQSQEAIVSFKSDVVVNIDNSIDVSEEIAYQTGLAEHHGIYRDIYPYSSFGKKMDIDDVSVIDESGRSHKFQVQSVGNNIRIKIGDPNTTFRGNRIYIIKYRATNAVAKLDEVDEIYWNATGNGWGMPIYSATATVTLPSGARALQKACYFGPKGSTNKCTPFIDGTVATVFMAPIMLNPGSGLTVAVGFPKGVTREYPAYTKILDQLFRYLPWAIAILLPIITVILSYKHWSKYGRDPKGTGVVVPQYDVPDGLTPMEILGILKEKISNQSISAEIVYLATKGYLKIVYVEKKILKIFKTTDYNLVRLKNYTDAPNGFDRNLLQALFSVAHPDVVAMSKLKNVFYMQIPKIIKSTAEGLRVKGYYKSLGKMGGMADIMSPFLWLIITFVFILLPFLVLYIGGLFSSTVSVAPMIVSELFSVVVILILCYLSPAKTEKGVATKEYLLGLKMYLQIAEKDRLQFHNAPEKRPEIFEKLLPYAMVFGVEEAWAKEFEGIYVTPPSWYEGPTGANFSAVGLGASLSNFGSFATSSLTSSPSGSGGGGSSGGGGGGGGGGSW